MQAGFRAAPDELTSSAILSIMKPSFFEESHSLRHRTLPQAE